MITKQLFELKENDFFWCRNHLPLERSFEILGFSLFYMDYQSQRYPVNPNVQYLIDIPSNIEYQLFYIGLNSLEDLDIQLPLLKNCTLIDFSSKTINPETDFSIIETIEDLKTLMGESLFLKEAIPQFLKINFITAAYPALREWATKFNVKS